MNRYIHKNIVLAALPLLLAATAAAQVDDRRPGKQEPRTAETQLHILEQSAVIGTTVTNGQKGDRAENLGSISDLILDVRSGKISRAVLASGGVLGIGEKEVAIEWPSFNWDAKNKKFALTMTPEAIKKLPEFDAKNLDRLGDVAVDATAGKGERKDAAGAARTSDTFMLASKVDDCKVVAKSEEFGKAGKLYFEPKSGTTAFISVSVGGIAGLGDSNYLIPWHCVKLMQPVGKKEKHIMLDRSKAELGSAPKLEDDGADIKKADFRHKVYKFHKVQPPEYEPKKVPDYNEGNGANTRDKGKYKK